MSDDDNVVDFSKILGEAKSSNSVRLEDRVVQCLKNEETGECKCIYCNYRDGAASMIIDFLARDFNAFETNTNSELCTYDLKDIFFKAIHMVKERERKQRGQ